MKNLVSIKEAGKPYEFVAVIGCSDSARIEKDVRKYWFPEKQLQEVRIKKIIKQESKL